MKIHLVGFLESRRVYLNGEELLPEESRKIRNHSPDGFNWGYGGNGPAQLALAILLKLFPREVAVGHYQYFKWSSVAHFPMTDFDVELDVILEDERKEDLDER